MRNVNDFIRALGGLHSVLSGIAGKIDLIPAGGSGSGGIDYSEVEQDTGIKWIDGESIYQKSYVLESPISLDSTSPRSWNNADAAIIDNLISITCVRRAGEGIKAASCTVPAVVDSSSAIKLYGYSNYISNVDVITMQYTKTSE